MAARQRGTVVFDLDGTLADTSGDLIAAANACFRSLGLDDLLDPATDQAVALRGGRSMLTLGFSRSGTHGEAEIDRQYPALLAHYDRAICRHTVLYPGAMAAVAALKDDGYAVAICTNKPEALARKLLAELGVLRDFAALVGADTLPVRKPDAGPLRAAVAWAGGDPARCCLVGDTATDHHTARAAGVPSILVTFGAGRADVAALAPDALLRDFAHLPALVRQLLPH